MKDDKYNMLEESPNFELIPVESSTEFTGLTPTPPLSGAEEQSYSDIKGMHVPHCENAIPKIKRLTFRESQKSEKGKLQKLGR